ncbi:MAG: substrate-binding domain-containing protein [Burkholderiaceae bacterium]
MQKVAGFVVGVARARSAIRAAIADGSYPVSRPLFFYVKNAHVGKTPGIKEFIAEFTSEKAWGKDGYLAEKGMIPMPDAERKKYAAEANGLKVNIKGM